MKPSAASLMMILALEFSSPLRSVAVLRSRAAASHPDVLAEVIETGPGATHPFEMIEGALQRAGIEREEIAVLALGLGPGSYNGIRAAIAVAQGWQLARGTKLIGLSSAQTIAAQAHADGLQGRCGVVIDAQRNEFYLAEYELHRQGWRELLPLRLVSLAELRLHTAQSELLIGPEVMRWFPAGKTVSPRAATLAGLALGRTDFVPGEKLEPIYLRETKFVKAPKPRTIP